MFDRNQSEAATVPDDVAELLDALRARLTDLADRQPLAALTAAAHLKATEEAASVQAADAVLRRKGGSWAKVGAALGVTKQAAHQRLARRIAARGAAVRASLPPGEREKERSAATPRVTEPVATAAPIPAESAQLVVIEEPDNVLIGEVVLPDDRDSGPQSRLRRLLLAYQENPAREYPYATCPTCHLTGPRARSAHLGIRTARSTGQRPRGSAVTSAPLITTSTARTSPRRGPPRRALAAPWRSTTPSAPPGSSAPAATSSPRPGR